MDLLLFNTILNMCWYIFTLLFFLYRFTSFFTHFYGFFKFCKKLYNGIHYSFLQCSDYIFYNQRRQIERPVTSRWASFKNWLFGRRTDYIPLHNTWTESKSTLIPLGTSNQIDIPINDNETESVSSNSSEIANQMFDVAFDFGQTNSTKNIYGIENSNALFESTLIKKQMTPNNTAMMTSFYTEKDLVKNPFI